MKTVIMEVLQQTVGEGKDRKTIEKLLVERIIQLALKGDSRMIKMIWEYRDGKPPPYRGDGDSSTPSMRGKRKLPEVESEEETMDMPVYPWGKSAYE